jgi:AcrR family transcriptional regulator
MSNRLKTSPRKHPQQGRSRETVDALLEATAQLLVRDGIEKVSTNKIALKAGVSIGSLYQYFPSKEALIAELLDRHYNEMSRITKEAMTIHWGQSLAVIIRETVRAMVSLHAANPKLHAVLQDLIPSVGKQSKLGQLHSETEMRVRELLHDRISELRVRDIDMAAFIVVETVDSLLHASLEPRKEQWNVESIVDEITDLLLAYLLK